MADRKRLAIRFSEKGPFGDACALLARERIHFALAGFLTTVIDEEDYRRVRTHLSGVPVLPVPRHEKRPAPLSADQVQQLLRDFAKSV